MVESVIEALEPFALTLIIFAGAYMLGWVKFTNPKAVGYAVLFSSILLFTRHVIARVKSKREK